MAAAIVAAVVMTWDQIFPTPPEKLVTVYRVHRCGCVTQWVRALKDEGFTVRLFELNNLHTMRKTLRTPANMQGCHVATYLSYFVEGHVPASMLRQLASERPSATGVATQADLSNRAYRVNVITAYNYLLVGKDGVQRPWGNTPTP